MMRLDPAVPTLALVLRHVAALIGVPVEDVIADRGDEAAEARRLFCWLAGFGTDASVEAIAYSVCIDADQAKALQALVAARRKTDVAFRETLDEVALEIHCEAACVKRKIVAGAPDRDAAGTARRVLSGNRQALVVPIVDLVHLAASYELLLARVADLDRATKAMLAAQFTPGERHAREAQARAQHRLVATTVPPTSKVHN